MALSIEEFHLPNLIRDGVERKKLKFLPRMSDDLDKVNCPRMIFDDLGYNTAPMVPDCK
jgi:hypothetical protein